ncbi:MAG: hypothetical protein KA354_05790 [Phycisphaerae bacterium]|nr:hypothetical protein [Phycisphaerae bacterium]
MNEQEHHDYCVAAGQIAAQIVARQRWKLDKPTEADIERLEDALAAGRERARSHTLPRALARHGQKSGPDARLPRFS